MTQNLLTQIRNDLQDLKASQEGIKTDLRYLRSDIKELKPLSEKVAMQSGSIHRLELDQVNVRTLFSRVMFGVITTLLGVIGIFIGYFFK